MGKSEIFGAILFFSGVILLGFMQIASAIAYVEPVYLLLSIAFIFIGFIVFFMKEIKKIYRYLYIDNEE
ncbi:hypothetical protein [Ornithinibacillus sp. 179-J 7C1 HS]|uniref:hypothetical protein n=1 Tax=Ornithinibacillus sp. 179-J 7C1 HS TaxID=3142384 RepID=UPI0039A0445F